MEVAQALYDVLAERLPFARPDEQAVLVLEEVLVRFDASRYTPSREPFHSCRIW